MPSKVPMVAWVGPSRPGAGKPKLTAVTRKIRREAAGDEPRRLPPTPAGGPLDRSTGTGLAPSWAPRPIVLAESRPRPRHPVPPTATPSAEGPWGAASRSTPPPPTTEPAVLSHH